VDPLPSWLLRAFLRAFWLSVKGQVAVDEVSGFEDCRDPSDSSIGSLFRDGFRWLHAIGSYFHFAGCQLRGWASALSLGVLCSMVTCGEWANVSTGAAGTQVISFVFGLGQALVEVGLAERVEA